MSRTQLLTMATSSHAQALTQFLHYDPNLYAINVFTEDKLEARIPKKLFKEYKSAVKDSRMMDIALLDVVANAIKDWALSFGSTHYTHWFQPIHFTTSEKHESFLVPNGKFSAIMEFTGSDLIRGEPDASSFPHGGSRSTHQARGYTSWDPTSPPFVRETTGTTVLYIPTIYCSWTGSALDVKTPLLRSNSAVSSKAVELLQLLGDEQVESVISNIGAEQEFFVIDIHFFKARPDLLLTGRTLFGAAPPKGQELEESYFGPIPARVASLIQDVELELWKLGVPSHTRHNEVAPSQHEIAPIYECSNIAADHNYLVMQIMREFAIKHQLAVLFHEKPFSYLNGNGKHHNWSLQTDYGLNLFNPTKKSKCALEFQVFLTCLLKAVDDHSDLLRAAVATPGNDWRLGISEAPPAIISVYLGSEINSLVQWLIEWTPEAQEEAEKEVASCHILDIAKGSVAPFERDPNDRNRTSPFAFTGNKFEFRAPGSSQSVGHVTTILNTIIADSIGSFTTLLKAEISKKSSVLVAAHRVMKDLLKKHQRIIFEGDGYSKEWIIESAKRGLINRTETVSALYAYKDSKNLKLFYSLNVLTPQEVVVRYNVYLEQYIKVVLIEASTFLDIIMTRIVPAALTYQWKLAKSIQALSSVIPMISVVNQNNTLKFLAVKIDKLIQMNDRLKQDISSVKTEELITEAEWIRDRIKPQLSELRRVVDELEEIVDNNLWPLSKYSEILFLQ